MRRTCIHVSTMLTAVFCLILLCLASSCVETKQGQKKRIPEVTVLRLKAERFEPTDEFPGRAASMRRADVRPQVGGILIRRLFEEGSEVREGQILYRIDPEPYRSALAEARAKLKKAEADMAPARLKARRYGRLRASGAVSSQEYDEAEAAFRQAEAEAESCRASAETAAINLRRTEIKSPISGRIGRSLVTEGALVTAHQAEALAVVQQMDPIYVDVSRSGLELLRLRDMLERGDLKKAGEKEASVRLMHEDGRMYEHEGRISFSDVTVNESTGMVGLRVIVPNPDGRIFPGMYMRAILKRGVDERAILAPRRAVLFDPKGQASVFRIESDGTAHQHRVEVDCGNGRFWRVISGLETGDRIVAAGFQGVRHGLPVRIVRELEDAQALFVGDGVAE
ncbi:MAG: efflux RND transporter periplasmic adaptor subunit [Desulfovibrionaceae bacterium]|nr:efflux RND transporter periplasmic adaptor subunit [Desulfovibrionaceae bacterium]